MPRRLPRARPPSWGVALLVVSVLALAGLAAIGAREVPGTGTSRRIVADLGWDPGAVLDWVLLAVLAFLVYTTLAGPRGRMERRGGGRRRATPMTVFLALVIVAIFFLLAGPGDGGTAGDGRDTAAGDGSAAEPVAAQESGSAVSLIVLLVVTAGAVVMVIVVTSRSGEPIEEAPGIEALAASVDAAIRRLELGGDPRMNVIAAYTGLEAALADAGVPRRRYEAPQEYVARSLQRMDVDPSTLHRLTALFEEARFSTHPVGPAMAADAVAALEEIRGSLELM